VGAYRIYVRCDPTAQIPWGGVEVVWRGLVALSTARESGSALSSSMGEEQSAPAENKFGAF